MTIAGTMEPGFEPVREAFVKNVDLLGDDGAAFCLKRNGRKVVDLWEVPSGPTLSAASEDAPLQVVFSATKGAVAICVAMLMERGMLNIDAPIAFYWPEFAAHGKAALPVSWVLSHQAGLPSVDAKLTRDDVLAGTPVVAALANQKPLWTPGRSHGYHALTFGWLMGEVIKRITGKTVGEFFAQEVAVPLGLDFWIGLPHSRENRVAKLINPPPLSFKDRTLLSLMTRTRSLYWRTLTLDGVLSLLAIGEFFNQRAVHATELPAANGITNARSLARLYAATIGEVDGIRLFGLQTLARVVFPRTSGRDRCLLIESRFGLGFGLQSEMFPYDSETAFGHYGISGAFGCADPAHSIALGYITSRISADYTKDPRARHLINAVHACL